MGRCSFLWWCWIQSMSRAGVACHMGCPVLLKAFWFPLHGELKRQPVRRPVLHPLKEQGSSPMGRQPQEQELQSTTLLLSSGLSEGTRRSLGCERSWGYKIMVQHRVCIKKCIFVPTCIYFLPYHGCPNMHLYMLLSAICEYLRD